MQHRTGRADRPEVARHRLQGHRLPDRTAPVPGARSRRRPREHAVDAELDRIDDYKSRLTLGGERIRLVTATHGTVQLVEVDGVTHRVSLDEGGVLRSPAPALVVATPAAVGDRGGRRRAGAGAGVDEDGDGAERTVRRQGQGAAGLRRQPGRDRRADDPARAGRRRRGSRPAQAPATRSISTCRTAGRRHRRARRSRGPAPPATCSRCCSATTSIRTTPLARLKSYLSERDALAAEGCSPLAAELAAARGVRRLRRTVPQPAGR